MRLWVWLWVAGGTVLLAASPATVPPAVPADLLACARLSRQDLKAAELNLEAQQDIAAQLAAEMEERSAARSKVSAGWGVRAGAGRTTQSATAGHSCPTRSQPLTPCPSSHRWPQSEQEWAERTAEAEAATAAVRAELSSTQQKLKKQKAAMSQLQAEKAKVEAQLGKVTAEAAAAAADAQVRGAALAAKAAEAEELEAAKELLASELEAVSGAASEAAARVLVLEGELAAAAHRAADVATGVSEHAVQGLAWRCGPACCALAVGPHLTISSPSRPP